MSALSTFWCSDSTDYNDPQNSSTSLISTYSFGSPTRLCHQASTSAAQKPGLARTRLQWRAPACHAERSEGSRCPSREILRFAQHDTGRPFRLFSPDELMEECVGVNGVDRYGRLCKVDEARSATSQRFQVIHDGRP